MHATNGTLLLSATDLSAFLECPHRSLLDRAAALGGPKPHTYDDPGLEVLRQRGLEHERAYLESLMGDGALSVVEVTQPDPSLPGPERWARLRDATAAAMREGADVVYQGGLFDGTWTGRPDFLRRVEEPSDLGGWSYDVVDTKLAREAKGGALLQVLLYADLVAGVQGRPPERVHLALGGPEARVETFRVADYAATFRAIRERMLQWLDGAPAEPPYAVDPVEHCDICHWKARCDAERNDADHLALVAGVSRGQRRALVGRGVATVEALAGVDLPMAPPLEGVGASALERVHHQARIQVEGRRAKANLHELLEPVVPGEGLAALPPPSEADLFFDLEGDPYALDDGIEYLFGYCDADGDYTSDWALTRGDEKRAFEAFVDLVTARREAHPDLHVYHYATYEVTALRRLMGSHATREDEVDRLLRAGVFVDLHRVVRQGLRASVESYSIKKLEPFYGFEREVELRTASHALAHFEAWLQLGGAHGEEENELLARIEGYNRDDCVSTLRLRAWLETLRDELAARTGAPVPRPEPSDGQASEAAEERQEEVGLRFDALTAGVPDDLEEATLEQRARWLLAQLLEFHRRENKATWWEYFRCLDLSDDERVDDRSTLGGLTYEGVVGTVRRSEIHRYRFPAQDHGRIRRRDRPRDPETETSAGEVVELDDVEGFIDLSRANGSEAPHPRALIPFDLIPDKILKESLLRVADAVIEHGLTDANPFRAVTDLLLRRPPRMGQAPGDALLRPGETPLDAACRVAGSLEGTVLPIQGPPGSGKTFTGARMIVEALAAGRRVGVTATSHKVIANLLDEVCRAAEEKGVRFHGLQKVREEKQLCRNGAIERAEGYAALRSALDEGSVQLAAGTAWMWGREDMIGAVDLLVIDEAGQFSLANALAVAPAASALVMLGDPQQLEQPQQGVHPPGSDASALDHLLAGAATITSDRGLFLERTWRLHPDVCAFTSEVFYEGRLASRDGLQGQRIECPGPLGGSGLRFVPVEHAGNRSESIEEVEEVRRLIEAATNGSCTWTDAEGTAAALTLNDILVVAPYNAQVAALSERLPRGARVGTVDKFQGQQAALVIYSMTTSSADEAPRGMEFLYSPNRLNVATSRARCVAVVVANPALFAPPCRTPRQMLLTNAFCRFRELAGGGRAQRRPDSLDGSDSRETSGT